MRLIVSQWKLRKTINVGYGDPKCTATRNNRLFARNDTTNNLLFRVAVYFGTPYATLVCETTLIPTEKLGNVGPTVTRSAKVQIMSMYSIKWRSIVHWIMLERKKKKRK